MTRLFVRIDFQNADSIGPGKIQLLELVDELGSISGAARAMDMSYPHAWKLLNAVQQTFRPPVMTTSKGGYQRGRTELTEFGRVVVKKYRDIERKAESAAESLGGATHVSNRKHPLGKFELSSKGVRTR